MNAFDPAWSYVEFSLPQDTNEAKSAARRFLRALRSIGGKPFVVYRGKGACLILCRFERACERLSAALPPDATLRIVPVTDKQFSMSRTFFGVSRHCVATYGERNGFAADASPLIVADHARENGRDDVADELAKRR